MACRSILWISCAVIAGFGNHAVGENAVVSAEGQEDKVHSNNTPFPPVANKLVKRYTSLRVNSSIKIDGRLDEAAWRSVPRSSSFVDLITGEAAIHQTHVALLWDTDHLYAGYWIEEPFVQARFTQRDDPIYRDNDVELFLAFNHAYYEFEINAHGTIYEGLFVWQDSYKRFGFSRVPELDMRRADVVSQGFNGVGFKEHPRGKRWAFLEWDFPGARSAVHIDGTLNVNDDRDRGWTVELAFPWSGMKVPARGDSRSIPPRDGDVWQIDCSRFNQYREAVPAKDSGGWAWSHHGVWDSHIPEVFPYVTFSERPVPD